MKSNQNIEQLFGDALGSQFEVQGTTSWQQLLVRRNKARFYRFSYRTLNIYYVAVVGCALTAVILFMTNKSEKLVPVKSNIEKRVVATPATKNIESSSETIKTATPTAISKPEIKEQTKIHSISQTSTQKEIEIIPEKVAETPIIATDTIVKTDITPPKQEAEIVKQKITKKVVVVQKSQVTVKDTVLNVVTKKVRRRN